MLALTLTLLASLDGRPVEAEMDAGVPEVAAPVAPAQAVVPRAEVAPAPLEELAHWALWLQPLGSAGYGVSSVAQNVGVGATPQIYIPLGATVVLKQLELAVELTFALQVGSPFAPARLGIWASLTPQFHTGNRPLNGFFVGPKLVGNFGVNLSTFGFPTSNQQGLVALGFDAGYQLTFRHMYIAFVAGMAVGAGTNYTPFEIATPWPRFTVFGGTPPEPIAPVVLVNLNLLRIGGWN